MPREVEMLLEERVFVLLLTRRLQPHGGQQEKLGKQ